jgi:hypothetical protein
MYLLYLDESGVPELDAGTSHFVLLGIAVRMDQWKALDSNIERIKTECSIADTEIHTAWMARRYSEQESIPGFESLDQVERRSGVAAEIKRRAGVLGVSGSPGRLKA